MFSDSEGNSSPKRWFQRIAPAKKEVLNAETLQIIRDANQGYKPLERYFGTLNVGMAFGESFLGTIAPQ